MTSLLILVISLTLFISPLVAGKVVKYQQIIIVEGPVSRRSASLLGDNRSEKLRMKRGNGDGNDETTLIATATASETPNATPTGTSTMGPTSSFEMRLLLEIFLITVVFVLALLLILFMVLYFVEKKRNKTQRLDDLSQEEKPSASLSGSDLHHNSSTSEASGATMPFIPTGKDIGVTKTASNTGSTGSSIP